MGRAVETENQEVKRRRAMSEKDAEEIKGQISDLDKKVSTFIAAQGPTCQNRENRLKGLEDTTYGNGHSGLKTQVTVLYTIVGLLLVLVLGTNGLEWLGIIP